MKPSVMFALATALGSSAAMAQTVAPPVPWEDTPNVQLNIPGTAAAAAMRAPVAASVPATAVPPAAAPMPRAVPIAAAMQAPAAMPPRPVAAPPMTRPMPPMAGPPPHAGPRPPYRRMGPGQRVGGFWQGQRVVVRDYGRYGLYPPAYGDRWVRYYDDALLVGQGGEVRDGRYGLDWDQYGERWDEQDGIPVYAGNGDFRPDAEDYAYVDDYDRVPEGPAQAYGPPPRQPPVQVYERDGYRTETYVFRGPGPHPGWDYPPGAVVTETTVIVNPGVSRSYYVEQPAPAPHYRVKRLYRHRPAPPPIPYGEKG